MSGAVLVARRAITCIKTQLSLRDVTVSTKVNFAVVRNFSVNQSRNMKICQFTYNEKPGELRVGIVYEDMVTDLNKKDPSLPNTLIDILKNGYIEKVKNLKPSCVCPSATPLSSVSLKAPITGMDKVLCVGLNYKDHCEEQHLAIPEVPMIFSKFASCVIGPGDALRMRTELSQNIGGEIEMTVVIGKVASNVKASDASKYVLGYTIGQDITAKDWIAKNNGQLILCKQVDWEVEMCVVISKTASNVKAADANQYVLGYTVAQDISCRDWQKDKNKNNGQFLLGKAMDTFCPLGPWIVTPDETGDPENLNIKCSVNGIEKQNSNTNQLVHKIPAVIERLSSIMTLLPGDIILTGTPGGVGMHRNPPEYLKVGDVITSEIQNIGVLTTKVEKF